MRRYVILGLAIAALAVVLLFSPWNHQPKAGGTPPAFAGAFESGRTIGAQKGIYWYAGYDKGDNTYYITIPSWNTGTYTVTDGCQHIQGYWNGHTTVTIDFCVPQTCDCN
jgi:hypothetical protein